MRRLFLTMISGVMLFSGCIGTPSPKQFQSEVPVSEPRILTTFDPLEKSASALNLDVPFFSQSPQGDWGAPYQEACEEASLLLAWYYVTDQMPSMEKFESDLLKMIEWEVEYFGQYEHTSIEQTAEIARVYLGYENVEVAVNPTAAELRGWLGQGYPIVAPFAGRSLGNPYFTGLGPVYHNLVIRGYDGAQFITNDVGTRHGKNFIYDEGVIMEALHDWHDAASADPNGILQGEKKVLVVK